MQKLESELQKATRQQNRLLMYKGKLASIDELFSFANGRLTAVSEDRADTRNVLLDLEDISEDMRCIEALTLNKINKIEQTAYHIECYIKEAIFDIKDHGLKRLDQYISDLKAMTYTNTKLILLDQVD